jgi:hypothetical protein
MLYQLSYTPVARTMNNAPWADPSARGLDQKGRMPQHAAHFKQTFMRQGAL